MKKAIISFYGYIWKHKSYTCSFSGKLWIEKKKEKRYKNQTKQKQKPNKTKQNKHKNKNQQEHNKIKQQKKILLFV